MKVHIYPPADGPDNGDGGVRRVVEGQQRWLPALGWEVTRNPAEADVIACHITIPAEYLRLYPDKVFVAHCHGLYWAEYEWPRWALEANAQVMEAIRVADAVTVPSEWVRDIVARHTSRPAYVVPHGIDASEWIGEPTKPAFVLWDKTRPDPICDPRPMNLVAGLMGDVQFVSTFGDETENVAITGRLPFADAKKLTESASVYLATSRETFGVATLQALACGVPVVGYRWGATPEIVHHGRDGYLVDPGDVAGLADGIRWALENRERLAPACRETAERYRWEYAAKMYAGIYEDAVARRRRPGPRTSVIVTAYKLEEYLDECLASVAAQTDPDLECIIVDDASPDRCGEIADEWAARDPRFVAVHNPSNLYLAGARNAGIAASRGRYILPLDADDTLATNAVETLAVALNADRSIHIAYGNVLFREPDGELWHSGWPMPFRWEWQMRRRNLLPYSSMFRREVAEFTGGYRLRLRTAEDADFWCRASSYGFRPKMVTEADTLIYRNRVGSMSRTVPMTDYTAWYPWSKDASRSPAGAVAEGQLPVPAWHPPVIAVVIPVGPGHGRYVLDAIDSLEAQTFRQWECLVVNDSGHDLPPLPSWAKVIEMRNEDGQVERYNGVAAARNAGIAEALAPLFLPLDADDYLEPNCLASMFAAAEHTGFADVIYSDFWEDPVVEGEMRVFQTPDFRADMLVTHGLPWAVTSLTPRALWRAVDGYDERLPAWEDWGFALSLAERGVCFTRVGAPLWTYRKHTGRRRDDNLARREEGEAAIRERFGKYWNGDDLMACSSCGGNRPTQPPVGDTAPADQFSQGAIAADANMLIATYTGDSAGAANWRGPSGTTYRFAAGDRRFILEADAAWFAARPEFTVERPAPAPQPTPGEPTLASATPKETVARDVAAGAKHAIRA